MHTRKLLLGPKGKVSSPEVRFHPCTSRDLRLVWTIVCSLTSIAPSEGLAHPQPPKKPQTPPAEESAIPSKKKAAVKGERPEEPQPIEEPVSLETVEIIGRETDLLGLTQSASQGVVGQNQFKFRPLLRVGELVEVVPGMVATQHSGSGKANQYFLRGFNLDHGTDFAVWLDGVPMNLPTNAHGQGYLDLNMIIPELIDRVEYGKGPYYAEIGDFATAGFAQMHTMHKLPQSIIKFTGGEFDFYRGLVADSQSVGPGEFLYAGALNFYNGPWVRPMDLWAFNGMLRYTIDRPDWGMSLIGKGYNAHWFATNQIPQELVKQGLLDLYGTMNPTDGGNTNRYSLSANLWSRGDGYRNEANFYVSYYDLALYSDFTYFLVYPEQGDQILQRESSRMIYGGNASQTWFNQLFGTAMDNSLGIQVRSDVIDGLELANTEFRQVFNVATLNNVVETSIGLYAKSENRWTSWFRTIAGIREDIYKFNVRSEVHTENSGARTASIASPKLSFIFGPWAETEFFVNMGYGFHSNDARGAVQKFNPVSGDPVHPVTPLARARGAEVGARSQYIDGLNTTLAFWFLHSDSELVFVGDEGTTEPMGPGNRYGVEWTNYYQPTHWLTLDADLAFTKSYFTDLPSSENRIPNSVGNVITSGATVQMPHGLWSTLRLRHFSNVPLNEAGTVFMGSTTLVNFALGWQQQNVKATFELFNLFDSRANDIAYFYTYRLPDQPPEGVEGKLIHPVEPRMVRGTISISF